jgi:hypothetical protein
MKKFILISTWGIACMCVTGCTVSLSVFCEKQWCVEPFTPGKPDATTKVEWKASRDFK